MTAGTLEALMPEAGSMAGIVIGKELAQKLGVTVGDSLQVLIARRGADAIWRAAEAARAQGRWYLQSRAVRIRQLVRLRPSQCRREATRPSSPGSHRGEGRRLFAAADVAAAISSHLGPDYDAQDWADLNKSLFSALWLEKMAISITIGLIVMVAALNIVASLVLLVMEKTRDIAILKTMGSSAASIRRIFMLQGLVIGVVGTIVGAAGGYALIYVLDRYQLIRVQHRRLSDLARAVPAVAARFRRGRGLGDPRLLRRHHLSIAAGVEARSGASAQVPVKR